MVAPIPKSLLIHKIEYSDFVKGRNDDYYADPIKVKFVRLEPKTKLIRGANGEEERSNTILFWDSTYSDECRFHKNSKVYFNKKEMVVKQVDLLYAEDGETVHHLEVLLQ